MPKGAAVFRLCSVALVNCVETLISNDLITLGAVGLNSCEWTQPVIILRI